MHTAVATATPVHPSTTNPKQPQPRQTAKEVIAANVKELIAQLEAGRSDALTAYLDAMSRFHSYSFGNVLEIARQHPTATRVAGVYAWNQLGRKVRKGERGIRILAPIIGIKRKKDEEAEKDITKQNTRVLVGFRNAYVFDRLSRDLRPAWPATARRRRARGVQACSSMAAATSSLSSVARCKAVWMRTSSSSRAAICPAGSLCPLAAFRLR
jgi:hypothetical protein